MQFIDKLKNKEYLCFNHVDSVFDGHTFQMSKILSVKLKKTIADDVCPYLADTEINISQIESNQEETSEFALSEHCSSGNQFKFLRFVVLHFTMYSRYPSSVGLHMKGDNNLLTLLGGLPLWKGDHRPLVLRLKF